MKAVFYAALAGVTVIGGIAGAGAPAAQAEPACCDSEFDWAAPYANALDAHGLTALKVQMGITSALAMEDACGLVPAIGASQTVDKIAADYDITSGQAGKLIVAAADVCPGIAPSLG
jgi:hypothetical protein